MVDEVPALREVVFQVLDHRSFERNAHVRPAHTRVEFAIKLVVLPMLDIIEVHDPSIVIVLAWKYDSVKIPRVSIRNTVLVCIPPAVAQVETAHESDMAVNQAELLYR